MKSLTRRPVNVSGCGLCPPVIWVNIHATDFCWASAMWQRSKFRERFKDFIRSSQAAQNDLGISLGMPKSSRSLTDVLLLFFLHRALRVCQNLLCHRLRHDVVVVNLHAIAAFALRH